MAISTKDTSSTFSPENLCESQGFCGPEGSIQAFVAYLVALGLLILTQSTVGERDSTDLTECPDGVLVEKYDLEPKLQMTWRMVQISQRASYSSWSSRNSSP